jgi:hypothetical protein
MGRGLSDLQRHILSETATRDKVHLAEILMGYFGWEPTCLYPSKPGERPRGNNFSIDEIGWNKYRSVTAAVRRSFFRLHERGLIEICYYQFGKSWLARITDKGREYLSVST